METFKFRFERVLDVRLIREDRLQSDVASRERLLADARDDARALKQRVAEREEELRGQSGGMVAVERTRLLFDFIAFLRKRLVECESRVATCERELAECKDALIRAVKERKALESLRERDYRAYRDELARREQKEMDEMAGQARVRGVGRYR